MPGPGNFENKVFTAPLAIIKIGGVAVGKIRTLSFTENVQRGEVQGLGELFLSEVPPLSVRCTFTADSYLINCNKFGDVEDPFWPTRASTTQEFANTILLGELGVDIFVYSKIPGNYNGTIITDIEQYKIGVVSNCFLDSKVIQANEGQIAGKNISGRYLTPMLM